MEGGQMRADDEADFKAFAAARMVQLRRTAYLICGDWHRADDAVQNVLVKLYVHWERIGGTERLDAYVRTMLIRAALEHRRRFWWQREISTGSPPDSVSAGSTQVEDRIVLVHALAAMPTRQRAVVVLRFWEDLDVAETAHILGCSEGTVKSQSSRGLARLRSLLADPHLMKETS
jgi:RNA polymerase sigma-70 factor (sigma-E family)